MSEVFVGRVEDFSPYSRKVVEYDDVEVGVFCLGEEFVAWRNECAHQGGPICQGRLYPKVEEPVQDDGTVRGMRYVDGAMHIVCPWHGYEYDLRTGANHGHPRLRLKKVDVAVRDGGVYVSF